MGNFAVIQGKSEGKRMIGLFDVQSIENADPNLGWSLWVCTPLIFPNNEGLCENSEAEDLNLFEDMIGEKLEEFKTKFVGRITFDGAREIYYYLENAEKANNVLKQLINVDGARGFQYEMEFDPDWSIVKSYFER